MTHLPRATHTAPSPHLPHRALLTQRTHAPKRVPLQVSESHSVACPIITWYKRSLCQDQQQIEKLRAKGTPQEPQYVKIRLNRQNCRNLHAPRQKPPYLCTKTNQKCPLPHWPYWPYIAQEHESHPAGHNQ